jgi:hypothetical protein
MIYLRDIRDLEVARYQTDVLAAKERSRHKREVASIKGEISELEKPNYWKKPSYDGAPFLVLSLMGFLLELGFLYWM